MKVNVSRTVEVSEEVRAEMAKALGKKVITREEIQEFIWLHGQNWEDQFGEPELDGMDLL